jgi:methionine-rich copper-binding protein CopC
LSLAAALLLLLLFAAPAEAHHVRIVRSDPPAGASLSAPPRAVLVLLDQPVEMPGSGLAVTDARGVRVDRGATARGEVDHASLAVELPPLPPGAYTVTWRVTSQADAEFNQGSFDFTLRPDLGAGWPDRGRLGALGLVVLVLGALFMLGDRAPTHNRQERID